MGADIADECVWIEDRVLELDGFLDLHDPWSMALLCGFVRNSIELVWFEGVWFALGSIAEEWTNERHPQLTELIDHSIEMIPFGEGGKDLDTGRDWWIGIDTIDRDSECGL